ncbi:hypothetical protein GYMLUDRAFT_748100 [Collybiopsis luxurians FD-317 M1]|uniref:Protein kinase domain-containing protein n=1 Tax=Collybiopsis luxurians FD-317 M1 TaxID=944289 RepID=A0A0D0C5K3_9AGAR|nr:hypothetical protein GYMLUDRAFT_748100 [Collybiopsis luxurians FD-317 M1]
MSPRVWIPDITSSSPSSDSSFDEDEVNYRVKPYWPKYSTILKRRGFRLDTVRDVKDHYKQIGAPRSASEWLRGLDDDSLCPDAGLPDNLFRATKIIDGSKMMVKAVHRESRELDIIRFLSSSVMRRQPMNHCIPVHDLIDIAEDGVTFIVMEQWSPQLVFNDASCSLRFFLAAIKQCIEHCLFMHRHRIAHLDISLRNLLTDYKGHYAYIDFELSRRFTDSSSPRISGRRGTELPPECMPDAFYDPYKVDVWALGILILRACKLSGFCIPELVELVKPMLHENPSQRPSLETIMHAFNRMVSSIPPQKLHLFPPFNH